VQVKDNPVGYWAAFVVFFVLIQYSVDYSGNIVFVSLVLCCYRYGSVYTSDKNILVAFGYIVWLPSGNRRLTENYCRWESDERIIRLDVGIFSPLVPKV